MHLAEVYTYLPTLCNTGTSPDYIYVQRVRFGECFGLCVVIILLLWFRILASVIGTKQQVLVPST